MYPTSSQKCHWTFGSTPELDELRFSANRRHIERFGQVLDERPDIANVDDFLTAKEEAALLRIVTDTGIRFGDEFKPDMWPSVRWIAFAYFKRFYLRESAMEYFPRNVIIACYYLAAKVDEFNVSIDNFVANLRSSTRESQTETILTLEPEIMLKLDYYLTVHTPFRPFEGLLIEMKTFMTVQIASLHLDIEKTVRPHCTEFFKACLYGDVMLIYPPSQIALAAIEYALSKIFENKASELMRDFLSRLLNADIGGSGARNTAEVYKLERLQIRISQIVQLVLEQAKAAQSMNTESNSDLQKKFLTYLQKANELLPRLKQLEKEQQQMSGNEAFDSDDD